MTMDVFKETVGKACESERQRPSLHTANTAGGMGLQTHPAEEPKKECSGCGSKFCPKGWRDDAQCDVHGEPTERRIANIPSHAQKELNDKRIKAGKKPIAFPKLNSHSYEDECEECDDEAESPTTIEAEREQAMAALDAFMAEHHVEIKGKE